MIHSKASIIQLHKVARFKVVHKVVGFLQGCNKPSAGLDNSMTLEFHSSNSQRPGSKIPWTKGSILSESQNSKFQVKFEGSQCTKLSGFTASTKLPDLQKVEGSRPEIQDSNVAGFQGWLQESTAGFDCFKTPRFQSSGTGFQSSPGFQACNVRGHKLQTCTRIPRIQVSKVLGLLQGFRVSGFPRFQDLMTYETTRHVKERKMQTKLWLMERLLQDFQQRVSARFMPGFQQRFR